MISIFSVLQVLEILNANLAAFGSYGVKHGGKSEYGNKQWLWDSIHSLITKRGRLKILGG